LTARDDSNRELAGRLAELSPEARALLVRRQRDRRAWTGLTISRRDPGEPAQMSFAQWRLWFMEQLRPGTNAWNTPIAARVRGPLDLGAMQVALATLVERHETLRTVFATSRGRPEPVLLADPVVELPLSEGSTAAGDDERMAIDRFVTAEVARPFDLALELMIRARLMRLGERDHVIVLVAHHVACDGWSKGLLVTELCTVYDAVTAGSEPALPELPITYADFVSWQRRSLSGENLDRLVGYWRERLEGHASALALRTDQPRPPRQALTGAVQWLSVPAPLAEQARAVGREERATPFMTLMAAFKALLYAHTGQQDLLVGSPAAMRTHPELEHVVGLFANTLVYRTSMAGEPSFREVVRRVRETSLGVYAHQELPFEKIVEALNPRRDASRNPIVQVNMRVEGREPEIALRGLEVEPIRLDPGIARFDLAIELGETEDGYEGYLEYDTALFHAASADAYARDFTAVLGDAVEHPDTPLSELAAVREAGGRR
jgi:hypothetical protein